MKRIVIWTTVFLLGVGAAFAAEGRKEIFRPVTLAGADADGRFFVSRNITAPSGTRVISLVGTGSEEAEIDLNGFTLTGATDDIVIRASDMKRLVVRNGTLVCSHADSNALEIHGGTINTSVVVQDMKISGGNNGIVVYEAADIMIRRNFVFDSGYSGIYLNNPTGAPNGIIEENIVRGVTGVGATGIRVDADQGESAGLTIRDNSIDSSGTGISVVGTSAVRVSGNVLRTDSTGIWVNASLSCFISENRLYGNDVGNAITLHSSLDCLVLRNVMRDYVNGIAVLLSDRHHIEGNVANGNSNWGIWFDDKSAYNTYGGNTARGNSGPACPVGPPICGGNDLCDEGIGNSSFGDNLAPGPPPC